MSKPPLVLLITQKADRNEENLYKYTAQKFGKEYADKFRERVIHLFQALTLCPYSRHPADDKALCVFVISRQIKKLSSSEY